ncbi:MAG: hypothetical protein NT154_19235 [Verrucomicrobia bacterium]|nr:hypothetical protein [Verrucomicrobiota bacterium]
MELAPAFNRPTLKTAPASWTHSLPFAWQFVHKKNVNATRQIFMAGMAVALALMPSRVAAKPAPGFFFSTNSSDGAHPCGGLVLSDNTLYGTTSGGAGGFWGQGTVFRVNTDGKGFAVLHRFTPVGDAAHPTNIAPFHSAWLWCRAQSGWRASDGAPCPVRSHALWHGAARRQ